MSVHTDHRQRLKSRFENYGIDSFHEHEVLEMLLFYAIARKDTNPIAHRLIARFGSLGKVLCAPVRELEQVEGVGHNTALYLKMLGDLDYYRSIHRESKTVILHSNRECGEYMRGYFKDAKVESAYMLCLDAKGKVLACRKISEGSVNATIISIRRIVEIALAEGATAVVLAHNHPSGLALPSDKDLATTIQVEEALATIDVGLLDHFIMEGNECVSLCDSGRYHPKIGFASLPKVPL